MARTNEGREVEGADDDVDLLAVPGRGAEAFGGVDGGAVELLGGAGDQAREGVVDAVAAVANFLNQHKNGSLVATSASDLGNFHRGNR